MLLAARRMFIAGRKLIRELRYESTRDRKQAERIAHEQKFQSKALRRGTRKIDGKPRDVDWDQKGKRAGRSFHPDNASHEVFGPASEKRAMDVRTPWGWPSRQGGHANAASTSSKRGLGRTLSGWFRSKQVVDEEVRARQLQSLRRLVEDRYGRSASGLLPSDMEWSKPQLPDAYLREREQDQMLAWRPDQDRTPDTDQMERLSVVAEDSSSEKDRQKASGE